MTNATPAIIQAIRNAASALQHSGEYQWGHMGACNCGFLVQQVAHLSRQEIHRCAMQGHGDWSEQLNDYCPDSGLPLDHVISSLLDTGFDLDDLRNLERLSDPLILGSLRLHQPLAFNVREDVVTYMLAWAGLLEERLIEHISIAEIEGACSPVSREIEMPVQANDF